MSFAHPLGLLGLIGIPVLILIYIIKSHYAEQTVASTYLWQLSERFLKKKKRVHLLAGLLSLLLQILAVAAISLTVAGPQFILKDAAHDYCFVLDASGSMQTVQNGVSRFERGKEKIAQIISESKNGSSYSLIVSGDVTTEVFHGVTDRTVAMDLLEKISCDWSASDCADAVAVAQTYYTENHSPLTYLLTDRAYETENILLIDLSAEEDAFSFVQYGYSKSIGEMTVSGQVISRGKDATLIVELYVDGEYITECSVSVTSDTPELFELKTENMPFSSLRLLIKNEDGLYADNEGILYSSGEAQNNRTLLISDNPAYLEFALRASGRTAVETVSTRAYDEAKEKYASGYGLYIFDSFADTDLLPEELPKGASVWFFGLQKSISKTGFGFRESVRADGNSYYEPIYSTSGASFVKNMTKGLLKQPIAVKTYCRYVPNRNFTSLLTCDGDNVVFAGTNENGDRQVVFAFDLHDSDFPMKADYLIFMDRLLSYSFPTVLEETLFTVGDEMTVNVPSGCTDLQLVSPAGTVSYPEFSASYSYIPLYEAGTYTLHATVNGMEQTYRVFVRVPKEESYEIQSGTIAVRQFSDSTSSDGVYDKLIVWFILLAVAFVLDWGVYCYEQYQLR